MHTYRCVDVVLVNSIKHFGTIYNHSITDNKKSNDWDKSMSNNLSNEKCFSGDFDTEKTQMLPLIGNIAIQTHPCGLLCLVKTTRRLHFNAEPV